jgi:hypothetical protein
MVCQTLTILGAPGHNVVMAFADVILRLHFLLANQVGPFVRHSSVIAQFDGSIYFSPDDEMINIHTCVCVCVCDVYIYMMYVYLY